MRNQRRSFSCALAACPLVAALLAVAASTFGCSGGGAGGGGAGGNPFDFAAFKATYGDLETVAGAGLIDADGPSEWQASYEGGPAIAAELSRPHMAMADAAGNIYIADRNGQAIRKVTPDGVITTVAGTGVAGDGDDAPGPALARSLTNPNGLYVLPDGTYYVLDLGNNKIRKVTPDGAMSTFIAGDATAPFNRGLWVAADESEAIIAATSRVLRWTPGAAPGVLASGFRELGMVVRAGDATLAGDRRQNLVFRISDDGALMPIAGTGAAIAAVGGQPALQTPMFGARAVWPYAGGYFVGTHDGCQIFFVDPDGVARLFLDGEPGAHAGDGERFDTPGKKIDEVRSVTVDAAGNVIVVESDRGYVRRVRKRT